MAASRVQDITGSEAALRPGLPGDELDPSGSFLACHADGVIVPRLQCFCIDLEERSDCGAVLINSSLNSKLGEETAHICIARCEQQWWFYYVTLHLQFLL